MKTFKSVLFTILLMVLASSGLQAQTAAVQTSLSSAVAAGSRNNIIQVVSATSFVASTASAQSFVYFNDGSHEVAQVVAINSTNITVRRAQKGYATAHTAGTIIYFGGNAVFDTISGNVGGAPGNPTVGSATALPPTFVSINPVGRCTRTNNAFLPVVNPNTGDISDCILSPPLSTPTAAAATTGTWFSYNPYATTNARPYKKLAVTATTYTAQPSDSQIGYNTNVAGTITIPALTGWVGKEYYINIEVTGTQSLTIATSSGQTINGSTSVVIGGSPSFGGIRIYSDGTNWFGFKVPNCTTASCP